MYLSASNTLDLSTSSAKHLEITSTGDLDLVTSTAVLKLGGTTILTYPDSGADRMTHFHGPEARGDVMPAPRSEPPGRRTGAMIPFLLRPAPYAAPCRGRGPKGDR